jgi:hypothetical protein
MHLTHHDHDVELTERDGPDEIEVTSEMIEAGVEAMEPFSFTSMEGYDMERALRAAFRAMNRIREESARADRGSDPSC